VSWRWVVWSLLSPSQVLLGITIAGGLLLALGRDRAGRRLSVLGGVGLLLFGLLPTAHYLGLALETRFPQPELPAGITGIVLLSGAERPGASDVYGEPQLNSAAGRYTTTLRLATRYPDARLFFTGGPPFDPETGKLGQTSVARTLLTTVGIDPARLTFEEGSADTCDNAANSRAAVLPKPGETWVLVTSAMHMPRTMACFRAAGWGDIIPQPADYHSLRPEWGVGAFQIADNLALLDIALHEWVGLAYYRVTGRTQEFFPAPFDRQGASP
jgi:uncharacterized SAM-binding protein YcdF (DUF218 family)